MRGNSVRAIIPATPTKFSRADANSYGNTADGFSNRIVFRGHSRRRTVPRCGQRFGRFPVSNRPGELIGITSAERAWKTPRRDVPSDSRVESEPAPRLVIPPPMPGTVLRATGSPVESRPDPDTVRNQLEDSLYLERSARCRASGGTGKTLADVHREQVARYRAHR